MKPKKEKENSATCTSKQYSKGIIAIKFFSYLNVSRRNAIWANNALTQQLHEIVLIIKII